MPEIVKDLNWIDIVYVILFFGMVYKGTRTGVGGQLMSMVGWIVLIFVSIRYYSVVSEALFGFLLQSWAKPLSFLAIGAVIFVIIKVLERVFSIVIASDLSLFERVGGALVAAVRAFVFFGAIGIFLLLIPIDQVRSSALYGSKTCMFFVRFDASLYSMLAEAITGGKRGGSGKCIVDQILSDADPDNRK